MNGNDSAVWYANRDLRETEHLMFCYYDGKVSNKDFYGCLYSYHSTEMAKLCPQGWHVATPEDWEDLITYAGGETKDACTKLRTINGWLDKAGYLAPGTDTYGFSIKPAGFRWFSKNYPETDVFKQVEHDARFWPYPVSYAYHDVVFNVEENIWINNEDDAGGWFARVGESVRCVKD